MFCLRWTVLCVCVLALNAVAFPDSGGEVPLPGPGLSYGGIPYGSVSGNVAEYFNQQVPSSGRAINLRGYSNINYAPIEQYL